MTEELKEVGGDVGHRRVGRLMRQNGISVVRTRKHTATTDSDHTFNIAPDLLACDFTAGFSNQKCLSAMHASPAGNRQATSATCGSAKGGCGNLGLACAAVHRPLMVCTGKSLPGDSWGPFHRSCVSTVGQWPAIG